MVTAAVHRAVLDLLVERPWSEVSLPRVAERAGVHHATVYRRWGTLQGLVVDAVITRFYTDPPIRDGGSLRSDLQALALRAVETLTGPHSTALLGALAAVRTEAGPGAAAPPTDLGMRRRHVEVILQRSRDRGYDPPTADNVLDRVLGPLYGRLLFGTPVTAELALELVDQLLADHNDPPQDASSPAGSPRKAAGHSEPR
jgi:AcrR family transcriptional regulator